MKKIITVTLFSGAAILNVWTALELDSAREYGKYMDEQYELKDQEAGLLADELIETRRKLQEAQDKLILDRVGR